MQQIITFLFCVIFLMAFLVTGVNGQKRKATPRRPPKRVSTAQSASGAVSIFDVLTSGDVAQAATMLKKNPALANAKDEGGQTPLHLAAQMGDVELLTLLLENAKDVNIPDEMGFTPLHLAAQSRHNEAMELLVEKKANVNARNNLEQTPLHFAITPDPFQFILDPALRGPAGASDSSALLEVLKFLLDNKADINAKDSTGKTPLHIAAASGNLEVVQFLIDNKADINAKDADDRTPLGAVENYMEIIELLRKHGAK